MVEKVIEKWNKEVSSQVKIKSPEVIEKVIEIMFKQHQLAVKKNVFVRRLSRMGRKKHFFNALYKISKAS